jgi:hypothetical protein
MLPEAESLSNVPFRAYMDRKEVRISIYIPELRDHVVSGKDFQLFRARPSDKWRLPARVVRVLENPAIFFLRSYTTYSAVTFHGVDKTIKW